MRKITRYVPDCEQDDKVVGDPGLLRVNAGGRLTFPNHCTDNIYAGLVIPKTASVTTLEDGHSKPGGFFD